MKVKLMGYTQTVPETFIGIDNLQDFVAYCARVSNPTNQMNSDTAEKLIKYLIKDYRDNIRCVISTLQN